VEVSQSFALIGMEAKTIYSLTARCGEVKTGRENLYGSGRSSEIQE